MNVLDCVSDPAQFLREATRALKPGASLVVATPFDWAPHATPQSGWLERDGSLESLIGATRVAIADETFQSLSAPRFSFDTDWDVRLHDRAAMRYRTRIVGTTTQ
jgi:SAM-dependent methyltransferase